MAGDLVAHDATRRERWQRALGCTGAGILTGGGGSHTYLERMLDFDRIGFEASGMNPREIHGHMRRHTEFHVEYLLRDRTPGEIVAAHPHLGDVRKNMCSCREWGTISWSIRPGIMHCAGRKVSRRRNWRSRGYSSV